ncbi:MAG: signal transduction histidine kinase, partial [Alteromonadaceae bacterium]
MKKLTIRQVPLLFLFAPTLIAAIAIYLFLHHGFQASYELQLKANAEHVVTRVAQLSNQYLYNRQYSVLKEELQEFVAHSDSAIDNIVIYNKNGQFITALKLNQQVLHSDLSSYPEQPFYHQEPLYLAFGRIGVAQINHFDNELAIGFVQVSFNSDPAGQLSAQNYWGVFIITILAIGAGALLWRYRYFSFHRQLLAINHSLDDINKGFKHSRLDYDSQFSEINALHQQVNDAVSFFERRLTMKYFEVTALERNLKEANHYIALKKAEDENQPAVETQKHSDKPSLLTTIYQAAYQILQSKLAVIDNSIIADNGSNSSNSSNSNSREGATDEVRQSESVIDKVINELNLMLNEIKRLADISAGQLNSQPELISSGQLVNSISRLVAPLAYAKGLEVLIIQPNESFNVEVDINQVQQVLLTLIQHAIEATSQGYIKLTVELLPEATVPGHPGGKLVYKVQDTSVGFGPAQYNMLVDDLIDPKLFDDGWIYRGLSLLVAKKTIELMGGSFKIKSLAGLGAELTIELHDTVNDYAQQEINDYQGGNIVVYSPHIQSGDVIFNQLCDMGVIAILCVDEVQVKIELAKPNVDCAVLCRPIQTDTQQLFDKTLADIVARDLLHKCLLCTTLLSTQEPLLVNLPKSWKISNKP